MAKKHRTDDAEKRPIMMNGHDETGQHGDDIDGAAIARDLDHDLPSAAAILALSDVDPGDETTVDRIASADGDELVSLGAKAREIFRRFGPPMCPYCEARVLDVLTPTLIECRTCESVYRPKYDPAHLFTSLPGPDGCPAMTKDVVAVFGPFRHGMKRRFVIARDYACHTPTGLVRLAERYGYRADTSDLKQLTFTRPDATSAAYED